MYGLEQVAAEPLLCCKGLNIELPLTTDATALNRVEKQVCRSGTVTHSL